MCEFTDGWRHGHDSRGYTMTKLRDLGSRNCGSGKEEKARIKAEPRWIRIFINTRGGQLS